MPDVAEGQRVVAGHHQVSEQGERGRKNDLIDRKGIQVEDDVAVAVARERVGENAEGDGEERQDQ